MIIDNIKKIQTLFNSVYSMVNHNTKNILLSFDSIREANIEASSEVVSIPIETGYKITEYKYSNPIDIELAGIISRNSIAMNTITNYSAGIMTNKENLIKNTMEILDKYVSYLIGIDITTKSNIYENYTLKSYSIPENLDNYNLFEVKMQFTQIVETGYADNHYKNVIDKDTTNIGITQKIKL